MSENRRDFALGRIPAPEKMPAGWAWIFDTEHFGGVVDDLRQQPSKLAEVVACYRRAGQEAAPPGWFERHRALSGYEHELVARDARALDKLQNFHIERYCWSLAEICRENQSFFCGQPPAGQAFARQQELDREVAGLLKTAPAEQPVQFPLFQLTELQTVLQAIEAVPAANGEVTALPRLQGHQAQQELLMDLIKNLQAHQAYRANPVRRRQQRAPD